MARPSKGDRQGVTLKLPRAYFNKLHRLSEITGETKSDFMAALVIRELDAIDLNELEGQDQLPMSA